MNKKIGMYGSMANFAAVICFALSMLFDLHAGSYFFSMFIAFSFVLMMCGYAYFAEQEVKLAGYAAVVFSAIYTAIILLVYFAQLTTVRYSDLTPQAAGLLDFQQCGLLFNYDLLGYAVMSLATFFAGLTMTPRTKAGGPTWIGVAVLEFWCVYFCPISILSYLYFARCKERPPC